MADKLITIKQIKVGENLHDIDARYLGGKSFEEIKDMVQGVTSTYVIPTSNNSIKGYDVVVKSTENTVSTTKSILNKLTNSEEYYKLGDIILMEELSDGEKVFDRWVSGVNEGEITLTVLETQVAKHHHTIDVTTGSVLTGSTTTTTTNTIPTVGEAVTVLTGESGTVVTSVDYEDDGKHTLKLVNGTADEEGSFGHTHTISSHNHSVSFNPNELVGGRIDAYTLLSTSKFNPHTHTTIDVAGTSSNGDTLTYATGGGSTDTFIKTLTDSSSITGETSLSTGSNSVGLTTSEQTSEDSVGDIVKTTSVSSHTHDVNATTTEDVVTNISLADNVITSVSLNYVSPSVQSEVVTAVTCTSTKILTSVVATPSTSNFLTNCSVDENGVLSFGNSIALTDIAVSSSSTTIDSEISSTKLEQSAGSVSISTISATQTVTSGKINIVCTTDAAGEHSHGFSHTHAIPEHTHTIASHTHTYNKSVIDATGTAYTSLTTESYVPHTHENVTVISNATESGEITYVTGGSKTSVIVDLKEELQTYTTTSVSMNTDTKYVKVSGEITFPGLKVGTKTFDTTKITPAVEGTETAITSITFTSGDVITSVGDKTSTNIGGEPKKD